MDVLGFGALNLDRLHQVNKIAGEDEETYIKSISQDAGGSAANTIYGMARLGINAGFLGAIGNDPEGEFIMESLKEARVDISGIKLNDSEKTGVVNVFIDPTGERSMYVYPGANGSIKVEDLSPEYIKTSRYLHMTSFVDDTQLDMQKKMVIDKEIIDEVKVSFAPGSLYVQRGLSSILPIIENSHILFLNHDEVEILTARGYPEGADFLLNKGCDMVVITLGRRGCYIKSSELSTHVDALESEVVDTTGAGDAFVAGFLYGLIQELPLEECGFIGNALASLCIEKVGARKGLPDREKFEEYLNEIKSD
jgi:ribokinase